MGITSKNESMMRTTKLFQSLAVSAVLVSSSSALMADRAQELFQPKVVTKIEQALTGAQSALSSAQQTVQSAVAAVLPEASGNVEKNVPAVDPLIERGRAIYKKGGCTTCHGERGMADTPTGLALKARSFVEGNYKTGGTIEGIIGVLKNGLPGTAMVAFPAIGNNPEDAKAVATFLLALKGHPEVADSPEPAVPVGSGKISLAYAMNLLAVPERYPLNTPMMDDSAGAKVFTENCASCHGTQGQGGMATRFISAAPYYRIRTTPLLGFDGYWMKEEAFTKLITEGLPGKMMPGQGTLTRQELQDLYQFFKACQEKAK